ncbi:sensor histidine kinase [Humibacter sp. RRB41]|uniref:sensor histidine kinase n=1 Tax=Humibacter sp. RRB41 TaxID=2919946 RepID=UPI001FAABF5D|nr:sensor histidine kinase [Humibacter sp. RRB41]
MVHRNLTHVFLVLRIGLHVLFIALLALVVARLLLVDTEYVWLGLTLSLLLGLVYAAGVWVIHVPVPHRRLASALWLSVLSLIWIGLLVLVPEAAYLVFPLFFLYLHLLTGVAGPATVLAATAVSIVALGLHSGFTVGGIVGPLLGAGVALLIGLGYQELARDAAEREALLSELLATRDLLAASEREQGMLAERARLAREIHDTVAQSLSSIQMLMHAAERADPERPGAEHLRLAREAAAASLADTRRFIRELSPPALDEGLRGALLRLAEREWTAEGLRVVVDVPQALDLPMHVQTALLRITQSTVANVVKHAHATQATIRVETIGVETVDVEPTADRVRLEVTDDGIGFEPDGLAAQAAGSDSFGLRAIAERVHQLGGDLQVISAPGRGTSIVVEMKGN